MKQQVAPYTCTTLIKASIVMQGSGQLTPCALCRAAYEQETRTTILGLDRVSKVAPNGKEILKDVRIAMYKGAKIGGPDCPLPLQCSWLKTWPLDQPDKTGRVEVKCKM